MATIRSLQNEDLDLITTPEDGISTLQSLFQDVLDDLRVPKKSLKKGDDAVINALYICILDMLKDKLVAEDFKYPTRDAFMQVYGEKFAAESDREKTILWQSANWMYILFKMITAKKNTGLTIEVIPKLVEGWSGKSLNMHALEKINKYTHTFSIFQSLSLPTEYSKVHNWRWHEACHGQPSLSAAPRGESSVQAQRVHQKEI